MLWYSLETPHRGASSTFLSRNKKNMDTFWLKKAPYQKLCATEDSDQCEKALDLQLSTECSLRTWKDSGCSGSLGKYAQRYIEG